MLVSMQKIISRAERGRYAVGAFNTSNLEITLAIVRAAVRLKSPVIIQTSESAIKYSNLETIYNLIKTLANTAGCQVPIAIHLDHGKDLSIIKNCLRIGYNSVHIDASEYDFAKNIRLTKQVVALAKKKHTWVQAELGAIFGAEGLVKLQKGTIKMADYMTDPGQAKKFVKTTGVDTLAVSVGTIHGRFVGIEKVDQKRLRAIRQETKIPLVLHGGSGLSPREFQQAIKNGVRIINIDTNLRLKFKQGVAGGLRQPAKIIDPRAILHPAIDLMQREVERLIKVFGSANKA
ncbi:MAG: class II fructose-bisphosphate aldolase [Patescibacteria group bacterium]